jgi:hypothetical protein
MDGGYSINRPLSGFRIRSIPVWLEYVLLVGLGVTAVALHQAFRFPMNLPGRHGIEWMALLVLGRVLTRSRFGGSVVSTSAALTSILPFWGVMDDPMIWLMYLIPGVLMDVAFDRLPRWKTNFVFLASLGALAHATKPIARWIINMITGIPYGSLLLGVGYPVVTHMMFGAAGGLLGAVLAYGIRKTVARPE